MTSIFGATILSVVAVLYVLWRYTANVFNTTIYLHRTMTHNSIRLHPVLAGLMRVSLWMHTWQTMKGWVCGHRKHHRYPDKPGDPHSPKLLGLWHLYWWHEKYYKKAADDPEILANYSWGLPNSKLDFILERGLLGALVGVSCAITLFVLICSAVGIVFWWGVIVGVSAYVIQLVAFLKTAATINSFGHKKDLFGYRNFDTDDDSTNMPLLGGWFAGGECWHNNHHYDQKSPKLSYTNKEFDPAWSWIIVPLIRFRLAEQLQPTINEREKKQTASH